MPGHDTAGVAAPVACPRPPAVVVVDRWVVVAIVLVAAHFALLAWACLHHAVPVHWPGAAWPLAAVALASVLWARYRCARSLEPRLHEAAACLAILVAYTLVAAPLSYFAALAPGTPVDAALAAADRRLGFDWRAWRDTIAAMPVLRTVLSLAYATSLVQIALLVIVLPAVRAGRAIELVMALVLTTTLVVAVSACVPAVSAWIHYDIDTDLAYHARLIDELHRGVMRPVYLERPEGIVTFPSLHTGFALLSMLAVRGIRGLQSVVALVNALVLMSIPSEGGHHLVDMIAGAGCTAVAAAIVVRTDRRLRADLAGASGSAAATLRARAAGSRSRSS